MTWLSKAIVIDKIIRFVILFYSSKHFKREDEMAGEMTEKEIIEKLSKMHKHNSTDPQILCSGTSRDFPKEHFQECERLRSDLFRICYNRGDF